MRPAAILALALALATCLFAATAWADEPAAQDEAMAPPPASDQARE